MDLSKLQGMDSRYVIFGLLFLLSNQLETAGSRVLGEITSKQWFLLIVIHTFFSEPPTISETAEHMGSSHQNVKQIALKLQEKGFLKIEKDPKDSRTLRLVLTPKTASYSLQQEAVNEWFIRQLYKDFSPEETQALLHAIIRMTENLDSIQWDTEFPSTPPSNHKATQ